MRKAYVILDGTLPRIDRITADRLHYSGKLIVPRHEHPSPRRPGRTPAPDLLALPGSAHDLTAARTHGIIDALTEADIPCWADKAYRGASGPIRVPYRGKWHNLWPGQQAVNRSHAHIRALGERAVSILKTRRLPRRLRCSATCIVSLTRAVLALHLQCHMRLERAQCCPRWLLGDRPLQSDTESVNSIHSE
ncbi:hypothetical protein GCM10009634_80030 [Saccharothrix xinjiangensis]